MNELERFRPLARSIARDYYLPGGDHDDVEQEAMIGVWKALRDFRPEKGNLRSFVELCVRRQVVTAIVSARRAKHAPLTWAARQAKGESGDVIDAVDLIADERADPQRILEEREEVAAILRTIRDELSPLERRALIGFANGLTYEELGPALGGPISHWPNGRPRWKRLENALQRAREKLADPFEVAA